MYTPHESGGSRSRSPAESGPGEASTVEHIVSCVLGLVAMGAVAVPFYPVLVGATRPLRLLSSTAVVVALVSVWLLVWLGLEVVLEWRRRRGPVSG